MNTVTLYTVAPAGNAENDYNQMEQFVAELNRFYEKFRLKVELNAYGMTLPVRKGGHYSVKMLQNPLIGQVKKSVLCCVIFFCKKEELAPDEMNNLMRNLIQQKKAEVVVYFKPNEDMQPVRNDIMRRIIQIDEKTVLAEEDQKRLSDMAKNYLNFGCVRDRENKIKEAEAAYRESLVIQRKLSRMNEEAWLQDLSLPYHNLGALYYRTNRLKEAEPMYLEAIRTRKKLIEKKGESYLSLLAMSQMNLGALYVRTERLEEAEKIYREALEIREKITVQSDERSMLQLADVYGNLGNVCSRQNRLEEAEEMFVKALDIQKNMLNKIQEAEFAEMMKAEAEKAELEKAGTENTEIKGAEAEESETMQSETASQELSKGQQIRAEINEQLSRQKQEQYKELQKKTAMNSNTLGVLYLKKKRPEDAEERYLTAMKLYEELAKDKPEEFEPPLSMVYYNLGNIYRSLKQVEDAAEYLDKAYEMCSSHKDTAPMCKQLYDAMSEARKAAMKKQAEIVQLLEKKGKEEQDKGQAAEAVKYYQQAAALYREMEGVEYQSKAALLYTELGLLHWDLEQLKEAEMCYQMALLVYRKLAEADESHLPDVAVACYNLGLFYQDTRDEEVNDQLREAFETAGKCLEVSEQCREIYENLENEPLYEQESDAPGHGSAGDDVGTENSGSTDGGVNKEDSDSTDGGVNKENSGSTGNRVDKESWLKRLFGKK